MCKTKKVDKRLKTSNVMLELILFTVWISSPDVLKSAIPLLLFKEYAIYNTTKKHLGIKTIERTKQLFSQKA
jgi:hypothetical protein